MTTLEHIGLLVFVGVPLDIATALLTNLVIRRALSRRDQS